MNILSIDIVKVNEICEKAGAAIIDIYNQFDGKVEYKKDESPLTVADRVANDIITQSLINLYPEIPIISEEEKSIDFDIRKDWEYFWLVDPLDGTKEFIKKNGEFTVNIALIHFNTPVLGFIYIPVKEILYFSNGSQSFKKEKHKDPMPIRIASKENDLISIGSRSHGSEKEKEILDKLPIKNFTSIGSSIKFCYVAEGIADIYLRFGPTMEWDTAAGQAIVQTAGGKVSTLDSNPFIYNKESLLNPGFKCNGSTLTF